MFQGAVAFDISIADPKDRIQAYIDQWRSATEYNVRPIETAKSYSIKQQD